MGREGLSLVFWTIHYSTSFFSLSLNRSCLTRNQRKTVQRPPSSVGDSEEYQGERSPVYDPQATEARRTGETSYSIPSWWTEGGLETDSAVYKQIQCLVE